MFADQALSTGVKTGVGHRPPPRETAWSSSSSQMIFAAPS
eukprot:SAG31_NODE_43957_length_265_cov_0.590361_1_plen_39_part_10